MDGMKMERDKGRGEGGKDGDGKPGRLGRGKRWTNYHFSFPYALISQQIMAGRISEALGSRAIYKNTGSPGKMSNRVVSKSQLGFLFLVYQLSK